MSVVPDLNQENTAAEVGMSTIRQERRRSQSRQLFLEVRERADGARRERFAAGFIRSGLR